MQVWHGTNDNTARPLNMTELVDEWTDVTGADQTADVQDTVAGYPHKVYRDGDGRNAVELYAVTGMDHGTPVDPGTGETQCGIPAAYVLDVNGCSSYYIAKGWGWTTPTARRQPSGLPARVGRGFLADGVSLGTGTPSMTAGPWQLQWNTASTPEGVHALSVRAYDAKGNSSLDDDTAVTVTRNVVSLQETFSDRDGTGDLYDSAGWTPGGWDASADSASAQAGGRVARSTGWHRPEQAAPPVCGPGRSPGRFRWAARPSSATRVSWR